MTVTDTLSVLDLEAITRDVWSGLMLDGMAASPASVEETEVVTASVSVTGEWHGHISVRSTLPVARALGTTMLGIHADSLETGDVVDALGELVSIIGGNVKALMPPPNQLSLPHIVIGSAGRAYWPGATSLCDVYLPAAGDVVAVSVWSSGKEDDRR
jgi:chemotaxis protein CheX